MGVPSKTNSSIPLAIGSLAMAIWYLIERACSRRARRSEAVAKARGLRLGKSKLMSLVEAVANVAVGYGLAVTTQALAFPLFGLKTSLGRQRRRFPAMATTSSLEARRMTKRTVAPAKTGCSATLAPTR
jgi:hypothetical protein